jgi:hypothetical protein
MANLNLLKKFPFYFLFRIIVEFGFFILKTPKTQIPN